MFDTELGNALDFLAQQHDINIVLDTAHLEALGIGSNTSVNASLKGISLQSAVNLVLSEFDLTFVVRCRSKVSHQDDVVGFAAFCSVDRGQADFWFF